MLNTKPTLLDDSQRWETYMGNKKKKSIYIYLLFYQFTLLDRPLISDKYKFFPHRLAWSIMIKVVFCRAHHAITFD